MANAYKEEQIRQRDRALMQKCQELIIAGKRVNALREYCKATRADLETAKRVLGLK